MSKYIQLMLAAFSLAWTDGVPFKTWIANEAGISALRKGDKLNAYKSFTRALDGDPLNAVVQTNLGLSFEFNEEFEKAAGTYEGVLTLLPPEDGSGRGARNMLRPMIDFNLGNARAQNKDTPGALKAYQAAFDDHFDPKMVKTNIELLLQGGGGGDGKGESKSDPKDQKESKDDDKKKDDRTNQEKREDSLKKPQPDKDKDKDKDKGKPKPFQSQELTPEDVKRILDEIKNQEQSIRAQENDKQPKDAARGGKDW